MKLELTEKELNGIIDIIDGSLDTMLCDVYLDHPDVQFWFGILRKCGDRGNEVIQSYTDADAADSPRSEP